MRMIRAAALVAVFLLPAAAWAGDTSYTVMTQQQLLQAFQTCSDQGRPEGCLTAGAMRNIIGSIPSLASTAPSLAIGGALSGYTILGTQGTLSGTPVPTAVDPLTAPFGMIAVTDDTATEACGVSGCVGLTALSLYHQFGGATAGEGGRIGLWANLQQVGPVAKGTGLNHFHTGIFSNVYANYSDGGDSMNGIGQTYGLSAQVANGPGAAYHYGIAGGEIDIQLANNTTYVKEGWGVGVVPLQGGDLYQGNGYSAGYGLWAGGLCGSGALAGGSGCAGFMTGLSFGRVDTYWPIADAGTVIGVNTGVGDPAKVKAAHGLDLSAVTFSQDSLKVPGFTVDQVGTPKITQNFAQIVMRDPNVAVNTGGLARLESVGDGSFAWEVNTAAAGDFTTTMVPLRLWANGGVMLHQLAFGSLPTCDSTTKYDSFAVSDLSAAPTYRQTGLAGGGTVAGLVFCNGTAWEAH
jgi:hypothetical protein